MKLTRYHPPIRRLQEDFAARIARRRYTNRGKSPKPPKLALSDNSEPWIANPDSLAEDWEIACKVNDRVEKWKH